MSVAPIRVLHWPTMTGGNPQGLARAEREIGVASRAVVMNASYFDYDTDEVLLSERTDPLTREWKRWRMLARAMRQFDILHFNGGQSLMPEWIPGSRPYTGRFPAPFTKLFLAYARAFELRDLPIARRLGKGIVVTYQGDDARQGDFCLANFEVTFAREVEPGYYSPETDQHKRSRIDRVARYADRIFALNPDLLHVLPAGARFLPYSHIDLRTWKPETRSSEGHVPLVLHAPSHRAVKGTRYVMEAVSRLKNEGVPMEFVLVEGMAHREAGKLYRQADILIDQVLAGWYGGLAVELMALGKPVLCYLRDGDLVHIPRAMRGQLPIINVTPSTVYETLKEWLTVRRHDLAAVGERSRAYVEAWHDPIKIAAFMKDEYTQVLRDNRRGREG